MRILLFSLLLSVTIQAQPVTPERRVAPIGPLTHAAYSQLQPDVASNGDGFVAVWSDPRSTHQTEPDSPPSDAVYATHLDADGSPSPVEGVMIAPPLAFHPRVASDGHGYLVAWGGLAGVYALPLTGDGHPAAEEPVLIDGTSHFGWPIALASNGRGYLLLLSSEATVSWVPLDSSGHQTGFLQTVSEATNSPASITVTNDGDYHLIYTGFACPGNIPCSNTIRDLTIDSHGGSVTHALTEGSGYGVSAVSTGNRIALAWLGPTMEAMEQVFDTSGNAVTASRSLGPIDASPPTIGWDGARLLVTAAKDAKLVAFRLTSDGVPIDTTPFTITGTPTYDNVAQSHGGGRVALVWSTPVTSLSNADVYAHVAAGFNEVAGAPLAATRLSNAPETRHAPATTIIGSHTLTVWRGGDDDAIEASIDGSAPIVIAAADGTNHDPDVAAIGETAMIVWRSDSDSPAQARVLARRIDVNGNLLDPAPIVVEANALTYVRTLDRPSIATDGIAYLVAWSGNHEIDAKRIAADGTIIDQHSFAAMHPNFFNCTATRVLWAGDVYLVLFALEREYGLGIPQVDFVDLYASRVSSTGVALDAASNRELYRKVGKLQALSAAASDGRAIVVWGDQSENEVTLTSNVRSLEFSVNPALPTAERLIDSMAYPWNYGVTSVAVAARGETFAVAWSRDAAAGEEIHAVLLDRGNPFLLAGEDAYDITAIPTADGFRFTYARTDPAAANVAQLFTRDLVIPHARSRAVR